MLAIFLVVGVALAASGRLAADAVCLGLGAAYVPIRARRGPARERRDGGARLGGARERPGAIARDPQARRQFWSGVRAEALHGTTVLFATHYLEEVDQHADRALVLDAGRIVADDTPERIKAGVCSATVRARLTGAPEQMLRELPGVISVEHHGETVTIRSSDSDATAEALFAAGLHPRDLRIAAGGLEDALLALTRTHTTEPHEEDHRDRRALLRPL